MAATQGTLHIIPAGAFLKFSNSRFRTFDNTHTPSSIKKREVKEKYSNRRWKNQIPKNRRYKSGNSNIGKTSNSIDINQNKFDQNGYQSVQSKNMREPPLLRQVFQSNHASYTSNKFTPQQIIQTRGTAQLTIPRKSFQNYQVLQKKQMYNLSLGSIRGLNHPLAPPQGVSFTQQLVAPLGHTINLMLGNVGYVADPGETCPTVSIAFKYDLIHTNIVSTLNLYVTTQSV